VNKEGEIAGEEEIVEEKEVVEKEIVEKGIVGQQEIVG